jgi:hypothetical protein
MCGYDDEIRLLMSVCCLKLGEESDHPSNYRLVLDRIARDIAQAEAARSSDLQHRTQALNGVWLITVVLGFGCVVWALAPTGALRESTSVVDEALFFLFGTPHSTPSFWESVVMRFAPLAFAPLM